MLSLKDLISDTQKAGRTELNTLEVDLTSQIAGMARELKTLHEMVSNNRRDVVSLLRNQGELERTVSSLSEGVQTLAERVERQDREMREIREQKEVSPTRPLSEETSPRFALRKLTPRKPRVRPGEGEEREGKKEEVIEGVSRLYINKDGLVTPGTDL